MNELEQKAWIKDTLDELSKVDQLVGINYWVNLGGSTSLFRDNGTPKEAVAVVSNFYSTKNPNKSNK